MTQDSVRLSERIDDADPLDDWELLTEVLLALVRRPEQVSVEEKVASDSSHFLIRVAPEDLGKVIGKNGGTISVLRQLFGRIAAGRGRKAYIQVAEPGKISKQVRASGCRRNAAA